MQNDDLITLDKYEEEIFCPKCGKEFGLSNEIQRLRQEAEDDRPWWSAGLEMKLGRRWCPDCRFRLIVWVVLYHTPVAWYDWMYDCYDVGY